MSFQKKLIHIILISLVLLGCVYTQRISIPLNTNQQGRLQFSVKYGTKQCEINVFPQLGFCSNTINEHYQKVEECGAKIVIYDPFTFERQYDAPFQLGNSQTTLQFLVPTQEDSEYHVTQLCLGFQYYQGQKSTLIDLLEAGQVTEERIYFNLYGSQSQNGSIGELDIGAPNISLIKKGANFVELKRQPEKFGENTAVLKGNIEFFEQQLDSLSLIDIRLDSPFHRFTIEAFKEILSIFDKKGIQYTYSESFNYRVLLPSIKQLQNLKFHLIQKDNTEFPITIKPSQYTRQLPNGQYQLLIQPQLYASKISLGYIIFETYYIGYDLLNSSIVITEKAEQQVHNFRGSSNISE